MTILSTHSRAGRLLLFGALAIFLTSPPAAAQQKAGSTAAPKKPTTETPSTTRPPTLADVAKREADRRKALATPGKVYTKEDLAKGGALPPAPAPADAAAQKPGGAEGAPGEKPEEKPAEPEQTEAWWRARMTEAREELRRNEMFLEALQTRINSLSTDFVNRDDPAQRARIGEDRQKALAEQSRVADAIAAGKKQILDIEEEARRAGVPPGWLR
jgi:hypothetical protein